MKQKYEILRKYNDTLSSVYDIASKDHKFSWSVPEKVNEFVLSKAKKGDDILDVGIGTGQTSEALYRKGCQITGLDVSQKMLDLSREKFPQAELFKSNIEEGLPRSNKTFDLIIAAGILEFIENQEEVLGSLKRFLKDDGCICLTFEEYLPGSDLQRWKVSELGRGIYDVIPESQSFYVYRLTYDEMENIFNKQKLLIEKKERFVSYYKTGKKIPIYYWIFLLRKVL